MPYRFVWNKKTKVLICELCNKGVRINKAYTHLKSEDPGLLVDGKKVSKDHLAGILDVYQYQAHEEKFPVGWEKGKPYEAVQGLVMYDGFTCTRCGDHAFERQESAFKHFRRCHGGEWPCYRSDLSWY